MSNMNNEKQIIADRIADKKCSEQAARIAVKLEADKSGSTIDRYERNWLKQGSRKGPMLGNPGYC